MIISMTGFSSSLITIPQKKDGVEQPVSITISLKTLNSRFLEVNCKLPSRLSFLETDLIKYFKKRLRRGSIQFSIYMGSPSALKGTIIPALPTIQSYLSAITTIQEMFHLEGKPSISTVLTLPDIFETIDTPVEEAFIKELMAVITAITDKCIESRKEEGNSLKKDLLDRVDLIRGYIKEIEPQTKIVTEQKKDRLLATLDKVFRDISHSSIADLQSSFIYNQLEKLDIHEEIVRFNNHLDSLTAIINSSEEENGKKIDFTLQELFREINTIASKSQDALISNLAISTKVELEKGREQAQNIV